jgi:hypothetical protein
MWSKCKFCKKPIYSRFGKKFCSSQCYQKFRRRIKWEEEDKMIEDEKLGLKVAENQEEALWFRVKTNVEQLVKNLSDDLILQKEVLELAKRKLAETENNINKE